MLKIMLIKVPANKGSESKISRKYKKLLNKYNLHYSISHKYKDNYVFLLIALSQRKIGADLELLEKKNLALLDFFKDDEYKTLGKKNWENFYILWTAKEAVIKLLKSSVDLRRKIKIKPIQLNYLQFNQKNKIIKLNAKLNKRKIAIVSHIKNKKIISIAQFAKR